MVMLLENVDELSGVEVDLTEGVSVLLRKSLWIFRSDQVVCSEGSAVFSVGDDLGRVSRYVRKTIDVRRRG